jgi:hypothetical protein
MRLLGSWRLVLVTATLAFLLFLVRSWLDWRFVFGEFMAVSDIWTAFGALVFYALIAAAWIATLVAIARQRRGGAIASLVLAALLLLVGGVATLVSLCPSPCGTAWPLMEIANWLGMAVGAVSVAAAGARIAART